LKDQNQPPEPVDEFQQDVGLAAGIDSAAKMRRRTQEVITAALRERLINLHDPRPLEKEVLGRLFFGPNPTAMDTEEAESLLRATNR
jgi:hypothetical protein